MKKNIILPIKYLILFLFITFLIILPTAPTKAIAESSVCVPNGSFEESVTSGNRKLPKNWTNIDPSPLYISISSKNSISGNSVSVTKGKSVSLTSDEFSIDGGKNYEFSFYCFAENADTTASITIHTYDNGGFIKNTLEQAFSVSKSSWQLLSFQTLIDENVASVKIMLTVDAKSTACYLDEVSAKEVVSMPNLKLTTLSGASLRLIKDSAGIRFRGTVDKIAYDEYLSKFENVSAGILFTVEENLDGLNDFTVETLSQNKRVYKCITAEKWNNQNSLQTDGFYGFNCAIVNIKEMNISKNYCARTYLKYNKDGKTEYIYGNFSLTDNARSVKELALCAMEDLDSYAPEQIEIIEYFANNGKSAE